MRLSKIWVLIALSMAVHAYSQPKLYPNWSVAEHQPAIKEGGRTNAVAINPTDRNEMFAASDSGGLFKSVDGGASWFHVDSLPVMFTQSVAYLPSDSRVILVTALADFKVANGGGVWRSDDRGVTWAQALLEPPDIEPLSAFGLSALGNAAVIGTSQGVFASMDGGLTWEWSDANGGAERRVLSVLLVPGTPRRVYAAGPAGVRLGTLPLGQWRSPRTNPVGGIWATNGFGRSPVSANHAYAANGHLLFRTEDRGDTWTQIASAPEGGGAAHCDGAPMIKAALRIENGSTFVDLYYGNLCALWRLTAKVSTPGGIVTLDYSGTWLTPTAERFEPRDVAFFGNEPVLTATNGGILKATAPDGWNWVYTGGGRLGGYNALQIFEVKGQFIEDELTTDLYFGTWDNKIWSTTVWANPFQSWLSDGFFLEMERSVPSESKARITWKDCAVCDARVAGRHLPGPPPVWPKPQNGRNAPVVVRRDHYVQNVPAGLELTENAGSNWKPFAAFPDEPRGLPRLGKAGAGDHSILYQPYRSMFSGPPAEGATWLMRLQYSNGNGVAVYPEMSGLGGLGINALPLAAYPVYGVDSQNWFHVIAPDLVNQKMVATWNGGELWEELPDLTKLVKRNDTLRLRADVTDPARSTFEFVPAPLVTAVSFHPTNPQLVLLGTSEGGIYYSGDRGRTWGAIGGSDKTTFVTSFAWETANRVYVSTFGRGLWILRNSPVAGPEAFPDFCPGCDVVAMDGSPRPSFSGSALVFDGQLVGIRTEKGALRELFVTPGSSVIFTGDPNDPQQDIAITESNGRDPFESLPAPPKGRITTGVVFTKGDEVSGAVDAAGPLSMHPEEKHDDIKSSTESPSKGRPYLRLTTSAFNGIATAAPGETFELSATAFLAGARYEVLVDGVAMKGSVAADGSGAFTAKLTAPSQAGTHRVQVRMAGQQSLIDGSTFLVAERK